MFCYQCEQTSKGEGCQTLGVCGKDETTATLQDLLIHVIKGVAMYAHRAAQLGASDPEIDAFTIKAIFSTLPHALDPEKGFRVRSTFIFEDFIGTAQPPSPLRWLADIFLPLVGARKVITNEGREFLRQLLEINSARVQNDVLNRIQDSRGRLEAEIRKLLHEVSRIAEQALDRARRVKEEGAPAMQSAIERLSRLERDVSALVKSRSAR